jgi:hypothetical protein
MIRGRGFRNKSRRGRHSYGGRGKNETQFWGKGAADAGLNEIWREAGGGGRPNRAISQQISAAESAISGHRNRVAGHNRGIKGEERVPGGGEKGGSGATMGPTDVRKQAVAAKGDSQEGRRSG